MKTPILSSLQSPSMKVRNWEQGGWSPKLYVLIPVTLVPTPLHKALESHSVPNPLQSYPTSPGMANTALIPHFIAYLFMGLYAHLFQPTAHFRLFLNVNLNFYLQILADPLNLLLKNKNTIWGFESTLDRPWIASSVTPIQTEKGHQQLLHFFSSYSPDGKNILFPHLCKISCGTGNEHSKLVLKDYFMEENLVPLQRQC